MTPAGEMRFEFATASRIVFGNGTIREAGTVARSFGRNALIVTGRNPSRADVLRGLLREAGVESSVFSTAGEPTVEVVNQGVKAGRETRCDMVVGFGGGSAVDTAKAIAAMMNNPGELTDYLEVIGRGQPLTQAPRPFIAIPTTAGTGAEVTRNAVIGAPQQKVKVSLRSPRMLAKVAVVDPELTHGVPPDVTAASGMDALTQCIEAYVSCKANPLTDAVCVEGIRRAARSLRTAFQDGSNAEARADMALASLFSGIALSNAGLGAVHGFAGPIGGMFAAPHGAVCAALLPHVMETNLTALRARLPDAPTLSRFGEVAKMLTGKASATADDGCGWLGQLKRDLGIPGLQPWGITEAHYAQIIQKASVASSMKGNPLQLEERELREILVAAAGPASRSR